MLTDPVVLDAKAERLIRKVGIGKGRCRCRFCCLNLLSGHGEKAPTAAEVGNHCQHHRPDAVVATLAANIIEGDRGIREEASKALAVFCARANLLWVSRCAGPNFESVGAGGLVHYWIEPHFTPLFAAEPVRAH